MIRDEIYRTLQEGRLHCRLESNHLLSDSPSQRPADFFNDSYDSLSTIYLGSDAEDCA